MGRKGFTLVEVLIVVIIIGILAAIGVPQFAQSIEKAKSGEARAGLGHIQTAEKIHYAENEVYLAITATDVNTLVDTDLDIALSQKYWLFKVEVPNTDTVPATGYKATATRKGTGTYGGQTITMTQTGEIHGTWAFLSADEKEEAAPPAEEEPPA